MADVTTGDVVTLALQTLVRQFDETEAALLRRVPESVHEHRTVVRRLRSVLKVFRDLYDPSAVDRLRSGLKEWGSDLGVVRDHEVAASHAYRLISDVSSADDDPYVLRRLVLSEREAAIAAHRRLLLIHDLERLRETRRRLRAFAESPPLTPAAEAPADALKAALAHEGQQVLREVRHSTESLERLHVFRKRARRLRYAVEAAMTDPPGLFGRRTRRVGRAAHRVQQQLGGHRDATMLLERVERAQVLARRAHEETAIYDLILPRARAEAEDQLQAFDGVRTKLAAAVDALSR